MSYFHIANATLSSALFRFTTEFGMGSGGSKTLLSPSKLGAKNQWQARSATIFFAQGASTLTLRAKSHLLNLENIW